MMESRICPYANYSLQFYLCFPIAILGKLFESNFYSYICGIATAPAIMVFIDQLDNVGLMKLGNHSTDNHDHSSRQTIAIIWRSCALGMLFCVGLLIAVTGPACFLGLGIYLCILSFFHFSEYFFTSLSNPASLSTDSFLMNNSTSYTLATLASIAEYLFEYYFLPPSMFKQFKMITLSGLVICIIGEVMRKSAILTAGRSFTHVISTTRHSEHTLITHGIYSFMRHPSYAGWFYWALGTQMIMQNPLCFGLFVITAWKFFQDRIPYEEELLIDFFGKEYHNYRSKVPIGIPFIST